MNTSGRKSIEALSIGIILGVVLAWSSRSFGLTWDETIYFQYADTIRDWFVNNRSFDASALTSYWNYSSYHNPHPPFMKIVNAFSSTLFSGHIPFPASYRMGNTIYIAACVALSWRLLRSSFSGLMTAAAVCFICLQPRVFGHLMIAATDSPIAMSWLVLTLIAWRLDQTPAPAHRPILRLLLFAFLGMASATKITGFMAIIPLAAYFLFQKNFRELRWLSAAALFALFFVLLSAPYQWAHPLTAIGHYLFYPFLRSQQAISSFYLGRVYTFYLPWHYFSVMTFATYPVILWVLLSGLINACQIKGHGLLPAVLVPLVFWLIIVHLPTTPKHDGIRQMLCVYPFLGLLSWFGLMGWLTALRQRLDLRRQGLLQIIGVPVILILLVAGVYRSHPFELSYYNCLIGGIRGAEKKGFEMTYYLEAVTPKLLKRLNPCLDKGKTLCMMPPWPLLLEQYAQHGVLTGDFSVSRLGSGKKMDYLLILRRRGYVNDALYNAVEPLFEVTHKGVSLVKFYESPGRDKLQEN